jgi:hypothetical protein
VTNALGQSVPDNMEDSAASPLDIGRSETTARSRMAIHLPSNNFEIAAGSHRRWAYCDISPRASGRPAF